MMLINSNVDGNFAQSTSGPNFRARSCLLHVTSVAKHFCAAICTRVPEKKTFVPPRESTRGENFEKKRVLFASNQRLRNNLSSNCISCGNKQDWSTRCSKEIFKLAAILICFRLVKLISTISFFLRLLLLSFFTSKKGVNGGLIFWKVLSTFSPSRPSRIFDWRTSARARQSGIDGSFNYSIMMYKNDHYTSSFHWHHLHFPCALTMLDPPSKNHFDLLSLNN